MPKVSVIMPVYNTEQYVGEAIQSILDQTFVDFEFIIIDDGSTDRSWEIIQKYAQKDKRIKALQNEENLRICKTLNKGIELAKGKYIARMDADDIAFSERFEKQINYLEKNNLDMVGGNIIFVDDNGHHIGKRSYDEAFYPRILMESPCAHPATICKKSTIDAIGGYDNRFVYAEDYDLWLRAHGSGYIGGNLQDNVLYYRISSTGTKATRAKQQLRQTIKAKEHALKQGYIQMSAKGTLRLWGEKVMCNILPGGVILCLFRIVKG